MLEVLFAPQSLPFAVALGIMAFIAVLELVGLVIGLAPSAKLDAMLPDLNADAPHLPDGGGFMSAALDWLAVGRVPVIVLIISFLTAFGITGLVIERIAVATTGHYIPALIAAAVAFLAALPLTRIFGFSLARVLPKDETEAVSMAGFIGKVATITAGTAQRGLPAEAKLTDSHGKAHYIRVEPDIDGESFAHGTPVLVVSRAGAVFRVIAPSHAALKSN